MSKYNCCNIMIQCLADSFCVLFIKYSLLYSVSTIANSSKNVLIAMTKSS